MFTRLVAYSSGQCNGVNFLQWFAHAVFKVRPARRPDALALPIVMTN